MNSVSFDEIRRFAVSEIWELKEEITENTALAHDFGVTGLDGLDFMEKYSEVYNVDLNEFDWVEYFGPEQGVSLIALFIFIYKKITRKSMHDDVKLPELTLGHLVKCANTGKWKKPNDNA